MSVILVDLGNDSHDVMTSNANWRDTLEVLRPFNLLNEERIELLQTYWMGEQFTVDESESIGNALVHGPLASINWIDNVYPPSIFWHDPSNKKWDTYDRNTYWPSWLRAFAEFCLSCEGFEV
ncbi:MAG: hypothetical protein ACKVH8_21340 [Pirellulales bacterium]|jgi:hypothetical protein